MREGPMATTWCFDLSKVGELQNSDIYVEDLPTMSWQQIQTNGVKKPGAISDHTSVIYNKKMYLYGGSKGLNSNGILFSYDPAANLWDPVRTKPANGDSNNAPPEVDEHTAVVINDEMVIFGGFVEGDRTNSIYKFDFKTAEWAQVNFTEPCPCPRAGHSAVAHEGKMYIHGGKNNNDELLSDMWCFDMASGTWQEVKWQDSECPRGRVGHSMAVYRDHILVFGGLFEITRELNDMYAFNLQTQKWRCLFKQSNE